MGARADPAASTDGREAPAPLWKFGWAGWTAVGVGAGLLALHASGVPLFYHLMRATTDVIGWTAMTRLLIGLYAGLDLLTPWYGGTGLEAGPHVLFTAGLGVGLTLAQTRRRWAVFAACLLLGMGMRGLPFAFSFRWWIGSVGAAMGPERALQLWFTLPMVLMAGLVCRSMRSWSPAVWFAAFGAGAFAVERVSTLPGVTSSDPALAYVVPGLRWLWLALWWWRCVSWGLRERRKLLRREGLCPGCDYDLAGLAKGPCPECGRAPDAPPDASVSTPARTR